MNKKTPYTFNIDTDQLERLKELKEETGVAVGFMITQAIEKYLKEKT